MKEIFKEAHKLTKEMVRENAGLDIPAELIA